MRIRDMIAADIPDVARLHREAFAGSLGVALGKRYAEQLFNWYVSDADSVRLVCELEDRMAGYVFGGPDDRWPLLNRALFPTMALAFATHPWVAFHRHFVRQIPGRVASLLRVTPPAAHPSRAEARAYAPVFDLVGIGVAKHARGRGIGDALVASFESRAWRAGFGSVILSVYANNASARRLYRSRGFREMTNDGRVVYYLAVRPSEEDSR